MIKNKKIIFCYILFILLFLFNNIHANAIVSGFATTGHYEGSYNPDTVPCIKSKDCILLCGYENTYDSSVNFECPRRMYIYYHMNEDQYYLIATRGDCHVHHIGTGKNNILELHNLNNIVKSKVLINGLMSDSKQCPAQAFLSIKDNDMYCFDEGDGFCKGNTHSYKDHFSGKSVLKNDITYSFPIKNVDNFYQQNILNSCDNVIELKWDRTDPNAVKLIGYVRKDPATTFSGKPNVADWLDIFPILKTPEYTASNPSSYLHRNFVNESVMNVNARYLFSDRKEWESDSKICEPIINGSGIWIVPSKCQSPWLKKTSECYVTALNEATSLNKAGKMTDQDLEDAKKLLDEAFKEVKSEVSALLLSKLIFNFDIIKKFTCKELVGENFITFMGILYTILKIGTPIILLVISMLDFTKALSEGEDELKKAAMKLVKRAVVVVLIFILPTLINIIGDITGLDTTCLDF